MGKKEEPFDFLEHTKSNMEVLGFWTDMHKESLMFAAEQRYKREIVRVWGIVDIAILADKKVVMNWQKRIFPLTEEELDSRYGKA